MYPTRPNGDPFRVRWITRARRFPGDDPVIVEGAVMLTEDQGDETERAMDAPEVKYGLRHPPPFWRLTPRRAFAWTDLGKDATRWVLPAP